MHLSRLLEWKQKFTFIYESTIFLYLSSFWFSSFLLRTTQLLFTMTNTLFTAIFKSVNYKLNCIVGGWVYVSFHQAREAKKQIDLHSNCIPERMNCSGKTSMVVLFRQKKNNTKCSLLCLFRLCDEYEKIAEKALTSPANTEHMMELMVSCVHLWKNTQCSYLLICACFPVSPFRSYH